MKKDRMILDETDRELITSLRRDARQSLRTISKRTGASVPTLSSKLQKLIEVGAIKKFSVLLDSATFGLRDYLVEISYKPKHLRDLEKFSDRFTHCVVTQDSRIVGIFTGTEKEIVSLYSEISSAGGVDRIAVTPTISYTVNNERPNIESGYRISISCNLCGRDITSSPVTLRYRGVTKYFCCTSCRKLFVAEHQGIDRK
ncbi:MAG: AsnC family transcriptional regulator [Thermoplasmata archaeon]|uniref:AsnC family transcriptional regulator n=1 Tax=Candidatus Sysuiplasma superficiale TaxID=2823368 RepID=A0A8J8CHK4_9ARCH|nr:AsnC family transcriptional regulator [Candidatus Sysuiplasma superficiale]MBX8644003.1 AsnC family transcriptional regulator [Candidatus Sysuiplasma superficiale]MCL4346683.1 winged helix-turn-helix transcriptional regulator [Candidatus Thermoplasmatota archaeon]